MRTRTHVNVRLTRKQAELILGAALRTHGDGDAWARIMAAIQDGILEANEEDAKLAARNKPCRICGRQVVHSARGLQLPAAHQCPHGRDCNGAYASYSIHVRASQCDGCRKERPEHP